MNLEINKVRVKQKCEVVIEEPSSSWRTTRQCNNTAKFFVNGKRLCTSHAQKTVFDAYILENPPI